MPSKDFKAGIKSNSLNGRKVTEADATVPFGHSPVREELEEAARTLPVVEIPIILLGDNPYQKLARPVLDEKELEELVSSIEQNGFYGALLARPKKGATDQYELAYGHRRKEAARLAGLVTLPVKVIELSDAKMVRIMASENFSRQDLAPIGEASVVGLLESSQNLSAREIAEVIGQGRSWVERRLALYHAPEDIKQMVLENPDTLSLIDLLIPLKDASFRQSLIAAVTGENLTRKEVQARLGDVGKSQKRPGAKAGALNTFETSFTGSDDIVINVTKSPQRGNGENYHNNSEAKTENSANLTAEKADTDTNDIVINVTKSPQRGSSEIFNNVVARLAGTMESTGVNNSSQTDTASKAETTNNLTQQLYKLDGLVAELEQLTQDGGEIRTADRRLAESIISRLAAVFNKS